MIYEVLIPRNFVDERGRKVIENELEPSTPWPESLSRFVGIVQAPNGQQLMFKIDAKDIQDAFLGFDAAFEKMKAELRQQQVRAQIAQGPRILRSGRQ
jgi:hypothetical protein